MLIDDENDEEDDNDDCDDCDDCDDDHGEDKDHLLQCYSISVY